MSKCADTGADQGAAGGNGWRINTPGEACDTLIQGHVLRGQSAGFIYIYINIITRPGVYGVKPLKDNHLILDQGLKMD